MKTREKAIVVALIVLGVIALAVTRPVECFNARATAPYCVD